MFGLALLAFVVAFPLLAVAGFLAGGHLTFLGSVLVEFVAGMLTWGIVKSANGKGAEAALKAMAAISLIWTFMVAVVMGFFHYHPVALDFSWLVR
jgi:hypothetical protein